MSINTDQPKLANRISAHKKYSRFNINDWIFNIVKPDKGEKLLDIGCGTGEQLLRFAKSCGQRSEIIGIDESPTALEIVNNMCKKNGLVNVKTVVGNMDDLSFLLDAKKNFDVVISCFSLYYSKNISQLITNIKKIMHKDGRLFVCGPVKENNKELIQFQKQISQSKMRQINYPMSELILSEILKNFQKVTQHFFFNPMKFPNSQSLIDYWKSYVLFDPKIEGAFINNINIYFKNHKNFTTTKKVMGILAQM